MFIENKYLKFKGLNLTIETLDGLLKHNGPIQNLELTSRLIGLENLSNKIKFNQYSSLESQISSISDDIAYNNHDIQDGLRAKMFNLEDLIEIGFFNDIYKTYKKDIKKIDKEILIYQIIRDSINFMVQDLIKNTIKNLKTNKIKNINDVYTSNKQLVCFSNKFKIIEKRIKYFLRINMYDHKDVLLKNNKGKNIIKKLFSVISNNPRKFLSKDLVKENKHRAIADFISGMTDRYAINLYNKIK